MKRTILKSSLTIAVVAAMVTGGTMAVFSAQDSVDDHTLAAGTLDVALTAGNGNVAAPISFPNMQPGDRQGGSHPAFYRLENTGSVSGHGWVTLLAGDEVSEALAEQVKVTIRRARMGDSGNCSRPGGNYPFNGDQAAANYFQGTLAEAIEEGAMQLNTTAPGQEFGPVAFAPGARSCVAVWTELVDLGSVEPGVRGSAEENVQNLAQGETVEFDLLFDLIQN